MIYIRHRENQLNTALTFSGNAKETVVGGYQKLVLFDGIR
jgi:hypothetical protein